MNECSFMKIACLYASVGCSEKVCFLSLDQIKLPNFKILIVGKKYGKLSGNLIILNKFCSYLLLLTKSFVVLVLAQ